MMKTLESLFRAQLSASNDERLYWQTQGGFLGTKKKSLGMDLTNPYIT